MSGHGEKKHIAIRVLAASMLAMPSQKTYGKTRKKSILPFFHVYTDEKKASLRPEAKKRNSATIPISAFRGSNNYVSNSDANSRLDDSIEEMASMLLDDTIMNELQGKTGKRLSHTGSSKILQELPQEVPSRDKGLPRLSQLLFHCNDAFVLASKKSVAARDIVHEGYVTSNDEDELDSYPPPVSREPPHARTSFAPIVPRKSSRRRPHNLEHLELRDHGEENPKPEIRKLTKLTRPTVGSPLQLNYDEAVSFNAVQPAVNRQIDNMLRASRALKPPTDSPSSDWLVKSKKNKNKRNGMLSKVKNAISERLHEKNLRKQSQTLNNEQILDFTFSNWADYEDGPSAVSTKSAVSAMELRLNEGSNLNNPKIQSLMGHGTIRRKPIAGDGKSLKSGKSGDIVTSDNQFASMTSQTFISTQSGEDCHLSTDQAKQFIKPPPNGSLVIEHIKDEIFRAASIRSTESRYDVYFDALFSSSPLAQSTPRLRLEPSFENDSSKKLQNLPVESRSFFDLDGPKNEHFSEIDITAEHNRFNISPSKVVRRNNSRAKYVEPTARNHLSKRRKKHPSPSKNELENLEHALKHYSPLLGPVDPNTEDDITVSFGERRTEGVLQSRDNNMLLRVPAKRCIKGSVSSTEDKLGQPTSTSSMVKPAKRPPNKFQRTSMTPKLARAAALGRRPEHFIYQSSSHQDVSVLATDELQWDSTTYNIGMKRT